MEVSDFRYGLETIPDGTTCLKGYINFHINQDEDSARLILPGFNVNPVNHLDVFEICHFLSNHCYWTKRGLRQPEPSDHHIGITVKCFYYKVIHQQVSNNVAHTHLPFCMNQIVTVRNSILFQIFVFSLGNEEHLVFGS